MIPRDFITEWRASAPWVLDEQVEQDLVISRALIEIYSHSELANNLAFRGGTALYKLYIKPAARYSEDIDLVQLQPAPIGPSIDALRSTLSPWLGEPQRKQGEGRVTLNFRFQAEGASPIPLRLKIEINTREHLSVLDLKHMPLAVTNRWFNGSADITTFELDELLATKLRALYQRRKGRDLFDLALALRLSDANANRIVSIFGDYMEREGLRMTRALFERNLIGKLKHPQFIADLQPLLGPGYEWDLDRAFKEVSSRLVALLPGEPWKGTTSEEDG